jgi:hypothetical protein
MKSFFVFREERKKRVLIPYYSLFPWSPAYSSLAFHLLHL